MTDLRWLLLGVVLASCSTRPTPGFVRVTVRWVPRVTATCFVVRATVDDRARTTPPMKRLPDTTELTVAVFRASASPEVKLEALGYSDEACTLTTDELSEPVTVPFVTDPAAEGVVLTVQLRPDDGVDLDGDGVTTPEDCDDGNPDIYPGRIELCSDTFDNDCDDAFDCDDDDCDRKACGDGRLCIAGACGEFDCTNNLDDDADGLVDCRDPDCARATCAEGGVCGDAGVCVGLSEVRCDDGDDNNGDGIVDCADSSCANQLCSDNDGCTRGERCQGGVCPPGAPLDCAAQVPACFVSPGCDAGVCVATPMSCPPAGACFGPGTCDPLLDGGCRYEVVLSNVCTDSNACTVNDSCQADGGCAGVELNCAAMVTECQEWDGTCSGGSCMIRTRLSGVCDGGVCDVAGACVPGTPWPYPLSNVNQTRAVGAAGIVVDCAEVRVNTSAIPVVTTTGCASAPTGLDALVIVPLPMLTGEAVLISGSSLFIDAGARLVFEGTRPVILAVRGDGVVAGEVVTSAGVDMAGHCEVFTDAGLVGEGQPGGSGAAFGTPGAAGGVGSVVGGFVPMTSSASGTASLVPLRGGCSGQRGGGVGGGAGGRGGGGLQLSVSGTLTINGVIGAPGEGGRGAAPGAVGGGGAGSGGAVLLEATTLVLGSGARVLALGGSGGEGSGGQNGVDGRPGSLIADVAAVSGGDNSGRGGNGGAGASSAVDAFPGQPGVTNGANEGGGGGGGAGLGRVRFNVVNACQLAGGHVVSPPSTSADGGCR